MNPIQQLAPLGQSLWYDNIQRRLLENGELAALIERGEVRGVTSNPSIFHKAIAETHDYDAAIAPLALAGQDREQIFWQLAIEDIRAACDLFRPVYEQSYGVDGYVSLEVSPYLANDSAGTLAEAKQLWKTVNRPNLMIKIPATAAGIPAIRQATAAGINVNITLIFSIERYKEVMEAYLSGLEDHLLMGGDIESIHSVASFFVSRVDTKVDAQLPADSPLRGKAAIANAKLAYAEFQKVFSSERFGKLQLNKANAQRPLWASTSTKNPHYPDTLYVDNLIGPATVNTLPEQTLEAFKDHGRAAETLTQGLDEARQQIADLEKFGISMATVTRELEEEGVAAFAKAFTDLLATIDERRQVIVARLGALAQPVKERVAALSAQQAAQRIWEIDPTLWTDDPAGQAEARIRLGWLNLPESSRAALPEIQEFAAQAHAAGFTRFLLLGMGGSSLAPEVLALVFGTQQFRFGILDSTDPGQVTATAEKFPLVQPDGTKTLLIVSSKSGGTAEVNAMFDYFWAQASAAFGEQAGQHFIAITDPGTGLEKLARERGFARVFNADSMVGGRYSALTHFGLVPAALIGVDLDRLLARAEWMAQQCQPEVSAERNPGLTLGALLGQAALLGRDKLTLLADPGLESLGSWLEQLIAESTGKQGQGIVPVDLEPLGAPSEYGNDRVFAYLRSSGEHDSAVAALQQAGHPLVVFDLPDPYDLAAEFFRWEFATATACAVLGVNAFDQPDVQDAKDRTKAKITEYKASGAVSPGTFTSLENAPAALEAFLARIKPGDYIAINAYVRRNPATQAALTELRLKLRARTGCATTVGFGPRFLHSTGQLHKGGADNGLFLQITAEAAADVEIPTQGMTFGTLEHAQALGDYEALAARNRRILRIHLPKGASLKDLQAKVNLG